MQNKFKCFRESILRKTVLFVAVLLLISCSLCSCIDGIMDIIRGNIMIIPDNESIGEAKTFENEEFSITLTDKFVEMEEAPQGFDMHFASEFCGVFFFEEKFTVQEGFAEMSVEDYCKNVTDGITQADVIPQNFDGIWYFEIITNGNYSKSYCYKGTDSFWIVQFVCTEENVPMLKDAFDLWAASVEVK